VIPATSKVTVIDEDVGVPDTIGTVGGPDGGVGIGGSGRVLNPSETADIEVPSELVTLHAKKYVVDGGSPVSSNIKRLPPIPPVGLLMVPSAVVNPYSKVNVRGCVPSIPAILVCTSNIVLVAACNIGTVGGPDGGEGTLGSVLKGYRSPAVVPYAFVAVIWNW
jgi:hypothetical protein